MRDRLVQLGNTPRWESPEQFRATVKADRAKWAAVVKQIGATIDLTKYFVGFSSSSLCACRRCQCRSRVFEEQVPRDALREAPRADLDAGNVAAERAVAHGAAPVEDVHAAQPRRLALQLEGVAQVRKARLFRKLFRLRLRNVRAPGVDRIAEGRDLRAVHQVDVEAGADDDGVENVFGFLTL